MTNEQKPANSEDTVKKSTLILCIIASIIVTFLTLEMNGLIKHNEAKDDYPVAEYKAIFIEKREDQSYRLSHKPSNQTARCESGYLFIGSDKNAEMQGLLVDYKNRGVKCGALND